MSDDLAKRIANLPPKRLALLAQQLAKSSSSRSGLEEPIAVVGMSCRFPAGANNPELFWELLNRGYDGVTETPADRWDITRFFDSDPSAPGKTNSRWGAYLDQVDQFDASFFGISPGEAAAMDPQQRILLELAIDAFDDSGLTLEGVAGTKTGVFIGIINHSSQYYSLQAADLRSLNLYTCTGTAHSLMANRLSYQFDLKGPSVAVDTACSSSLVALHLAVQSLRLRESDLALAGGAHLLLTPESTIMLSKLNLMAPDGHCKTFDCRADGFVRGEGCGLVVLKRLTDALSDDDKIIAIVRGSAVNQDGRSNGITAPSGISQQALIREALSNARVDPAQITYVETHGTGTALGDPIEIDALSGVLAPAGSPRERCFLGSVKANIGHLEGAAGIAGFIKAVLCLKHKCVPAQIHFQQLNPHIRLKNSHFVIATEVVPWVTGRSNRFAAVSSFGVGGTNAHVILEEAPDSLRAPAREPSEAPDLAGRSLTSAVAYMLPLSARSAEALSSLADRYRDFLAESEANQSASLAGICYTAAVRRSHYDHRLGLAGSSFSQLRAGLDAFINQIPSSSYSASRISADRHPLVFVFSGQGPQRAGMGAELLRNEPTFRDTLERCDALLRPLAGWSILEELARPESSSRLSETQFAQPVIFALQVALTELFRSWDVVPDAVVGHSIGEIAAAHVSHALTLEDALRVAYERGRLMQRATDQGKMASVELSVHEIEQSLAPYVSRLSVAAVNSPTSVVVAGDCGALDEFLQSLPSRGVSFRLLPVKYAFHSSQMDFIRTELVESLCGIRPCAPSIPFFSTALGGLLTGTTILNAEYWWRNVRNPVLFSDAIAGAIEMGHSLFLEVGPHPVLSMAVSQCLESLGKPGLAFPSLRRGHADLLCLRSALAALYAGGYSLNWNKLYAKGSAFVKLPAYPWQRKRFWLDTPVSETLETSVSAGSNAGEGVLQPVPHHPPPIASRRSKIVGSLVPLLQQLSGMEAESIQPGLTFMELGLDSLFLTQASHAFSKRFNIKITTRQMMEELTSLDNIAAYLERSLPDLFAEEPVPSLPPVSQLEATALVADKFDESCVPNSTPPAFTDSLLRTDSATISRATYGTSPTVEQIVQEQLRLMDKQLALLQATAGDAIHAPVLRTTKLDSSSLSKNSHPDSDDLSAAGNSIAQAGGSVTSAGHGPFKPLVKTVSSAMNPAQRRYLRLLIERYTARTKESKQLTQLHRAHLTDPRTVSGFRQVWKEMVYPIVSARSGGSKLWDVDGNEYIDFVMGFGANLFGHMPSFVEHAIQSQLKTGMEIGPQTVWAGKVAQLLCELTGMDRAAFCNTGSEAVMAALRVARTVTGRDKVVMFQGDYHGMFDEVLVRSSQMNGMLRSLPIAPGIPQSSVKNMIVLDYCSPKSLDILEKLGSELAAILVEPLQSRFPERQPAEFLRRLRSIADKSGTALIFDELVTGFRVHLGGAQALFNVKADLATYGKVVAGGLPIGVLAGKSSFMNALDGGFWKYGDDSFPETGVTFFAGTFVRHPLAMASAHAVLQHLKESGPDLQRRLNERTAELVHTLNTISKEMGSSLLIHHFGSIFYLHVPPELPFGSLLFYLLREKGIHIWENRFFVVTTAHKDEDLARLVDAYRESLAELQAAEFLPRESCVPPPAAPMALTEEITAPATRQIHQSVSCFPLTESQKEIWTAVQMGDAGSCAFNEGFSLNLQGPLSSNALESALQQILDNHDALRITFGSDGKDQHVATGLALDLPFIDYSAHPGETKERYLAELIAAEVRRPFDLSAGPLIRFRLIKLADDHHVLLACVHHIICDGSSISVLISELAALYSSCAKSAGSEQFAEFAAWQNGQQQSADAARLENYWLEQCANPPAPIDLPADHRRPALKSYRAGSHLHVFTTALQERIRNIGAKKNCTLYTTLLSACATWLHRTAHIDDFFIGIFAAAQNLFDKQGLVGHCVNFLPLRVRVSAETAFDNLLDSTKKELLNAYDHQNFTLGQLLQRLNLHRDPSRPTLISVTFNVDRVNERPRFFGLEASVQGLPKQFTNLDLSFNFVDTGSSLALECTYNADLFESATVDRMVSHFETLLESATADLKQSIGQLAMLTPGEREQILVDWNATGASYPKEKTLAQILEEQAQNSPEAIAATFDTESVTYAELDVRANQLAHRLCDLGVGPEVLVGVLIDRSLDMLVALVGILKAGGAYLPLDPYFPRDRLAYMVADSQLKVLVTHRDLGQKLSIQVASVVRLDSDSAEIAARPRTPPPLTAKANNLAYVLYTSGSTGRPKGVEIPNSAFVNLLFSMQNRPGFGSTDTLLAVTTLSFDIAALELFLPLLSGGHLVIASQEEAMDMRKLKARMSAASPNIMQATPATWRSLLSSGWRGSPDLTIWCGGEALPPDLAAELLPKCRELWNVYGPTETTIWSAIHQVRPDDTMFATAVPIGRPIANTTVFVLDSYRHPVPAGVLGELYIGGDGLARGYLGQPLLTGERFIANPFATGTRLYRTGDLARWRSDGVLECVGRLDNQVKIRGFRIELGEVEAVLNQHPAVRQSIIVTDSDTSGMKQLIAYFEPRNGEVPAIGDLRAHLKAKLPNYMLPAAFMPVEKFPLTPNGKVDRKALPAIVSVRGNGKDDFIAPCDALEQMLARVWCNVLRVTRVGVNDDFFELGGHSLSAIVLLSEIQRLTGKNLPLALLFRASTIKGFAEILRNDGWKPSWSSLVPIQPSGAKAPLFLVHGAEGNVLLYRKVAQYLGVEQPVYGLQSLGLSGDGQFCTTVPQMAARYIAEVRNIQPHGPYFVGGYCLGGVIAFEMAQQLRAACEPVELVIMLDTYNPSAVARSKVALEAPVHLLQNLWFHAINFMSLQAADRRKFLKEKIDIQFARIAIRIGALAQLFRPDARKPTSSYIHLTVKKINDRAANDYVPQPYNGRVAVIRPRGHFSGLTSPSLGWDQVVREGLEIHELPVFPKGMLVEPFCRSLADSLRLCLQNA